MSLKDQVGEAVAAAFRSTGLPPELAEVFASERPELGDFQCNAALSAAKTVGLPPRELAERIAGSLREVDWLDADVAGPGFINLRVHDDSVASEAARLLDDPRSGVPENVHPDLVFIDFGGPNVAKPLHVGHLRSGVIGDALQRLERYMGNRVISDIHLGDWGTQMGMVICGIRREQPELPYFDLEYSGAYPEGSPVSLEDLSRIYPVESQRSKEDPGARAEALQATLELQRGRPGYVALWQRFCKLSIDDARATYERLDIHFDEWNGESAVNDRIPPLLEELGRRGITQTSQGALVIPMEPVPMLLLKSDGAYLYATTDLATLQWRLERGATVLHHVADKRQDLHFRQLFRAADMAGMLSPDTRLEFHGFGTVNGPDGKPFKTRAGGVMPLSDLLGLVQAKARERLSELDAAAQYPEAERQQIVDRVALASLKFADLINNKQSDYSFDADRFTAFEGKTGPYLLYTAVRARSILSATQQAGAFSSVLSHIERPVVMAALSTPEAIRTAHAASSPHIVCEQAFRIAQAFNKFYQAAPVLREADPELRSTRLAVTRLVADQLELLCGLVGISVPERM